MDMMKLLLIAGLIGIVFTGGCLNQPDFPPPLQAVDDIVISFMESVEEEIPPPDIVAPYFNSRQEVPLNNIPNADMENWSVAWTNTELGLTYAETSIYESGKTITATSTYTPEYTGLAYYEGGSAYKVYGTATPTGYAWATKGTVSYQSLTPLFKLEHGYISFYAMSSSSSYLNPSTYTYFVVVNDVGQLITKKLISTTTYVTSPSISYSNTTGTNLGEDGKTWHRITIPISSSAVGTNVRIGIYTEARVYIGNCCPASYYGNTFTTYIDNFYYSTSDGSEIYLLEAPTAQFSYVVNKYNVTVDANISQTAGVLYKIKWNWGDGTTTEGVESAHTYTFPGNKQITLTIMDNENLVDTATLVVSVDGTSYYAGPEGSNTAKIPPVAGFSYAIGGMTISVDGKYSTDDGTVSLYTWDFDGVKKNGQTATHTYTNGGTKTVTLTVTDNVGLEGSRKIEFYLPPTGVTQSTTIVDNPGVPPNAKFTYSLSGSTITVDGSQSSDDGKIETYTWDWGDGSSSVGKTSTHTYSDMGTTRKIILTVKDDDGFTDTAEASITVQSYNAPPVVDTTDDGDDDGDDIPYTPPITGGSTSNDDDDGYTPSGDFPWWGLLVTVAGALAIVGVIALLMGGGKKKKGGLFKRGGRKR